MSFRFAFSLFFLMIVLTFRAFCADGLTQAVNDLKSQSGSVRQNAVMVIGSSKNTAAASHLAPLVYDKDPGVRTVVCWALAQLKPPGASRMVLSLLSDRDNEVRRSAAAALGTIGDVSVAENLLRLTYDADPGVKKAAIDSLGLLRYKSAGPRFSSLLSDSNAEIRTAAALALKQIDFTPPSSIMGASLTDSDSRVRAAAASEIGGSATRFDAPALINALKDPNSEVRKNAAMSLGKTGNPQAVKYLISALYDGSADVSLAAARSLGLLGLPAFEPLKNELPSAELKVKKNIVTALSLIGTPAVSELALLAKQDELRPDVISSLGDTASEEAVPIVVNAFNDKSEDIQRRAVTSASKLGIKALPRLKAASSSQKKQVRDNTAKALGALATPQSIDILVSMLKDMEESVVITASVSLGKIGEKARPALLKALNSEDDMQRAGAINALSLMGKSSYQTLLNSLADRSSKVRAGAAMGLGQMDAVQALDSIVDLMQKDQDPSVKRACAWTLGRIGNSSLVDMLVMEKTRAAGKNQPDLQRTIENTINILQSR